MEPSLRTELLNCPDLPTLPAVAAQIIELSNDPAATTIDIANSISSDPALAAKILSYANSPIYRRAEACSSIQKAVMALGLNATMMIALSFSLFSELKSSKTSTLDLNVFWRRSLLAASAGWVLAVNTHIPENPDEIFLASLLQDIGILAYNAVFPTMYADAGKSQDQHEALIACELQQKNIDHAEAGFWLLEEWQLPEKLCHGVRYSHAKDFSHVDTSSLNLARCVSLAGMIADACNQAPPNSLLTDIINQAKEFWDTDGYWITTIIDETMDAAPKFEQLFDTKFYEPAALDNLRSLAKEQLKQRA